MRDRKGLLHTLHFFSIHPHLSRDVWAFQIQSVHWHSLIFGQGHFPLIPCFPHIVLVGSQEELQLHVLSRIAVLLHIRVVEIAGVIERADPLSLHADVVALQLLRHRCRKRDAVIHPIVCLIPFFHHALTFAVDLELPHTAQVNRLSGSLHTKKESKGNSSQNS